MNWDEWHALGSPAAALARGRMGIVPLNVRPSANEQHPTVVDLFKPDGHALVVCLKCGNSWSEGAASLPDCDG